MDFTVDVSAQEIVSLEVVNPAITVVSDRMVYGPAGPRGLQGEKGDKGDTGEKGDRGDFHTVTVSPGQWSLLTGGPSGHTGSDGWRRGRLYFAPWNVIPQQPFSAATFDQWAINIQAAGGEGAVMRVGIYSTLNGMPDLSSLLIELTFPAESTGTKIIEQQATLTPGQYWITHVPQVDIGLDIPRASAASPEHRLTAREVPASSHHLAINNVFGPLPTTGNIGRANENTAISLSAKLVNA